MNKIASNFRYKAADTVLNLAMRTENAGLQRDLSSPPKAGWFQGGTGLYCRPDKIYEALQYYEIANEIYPSATTLNWKALALETLLDFPAALQAYKDLEDWVRKNEADSSAYIEASSSGQARCQGKPKGSFPAIPAVAEDALDQLESLNTENDEREVDTIAIAFVDALMLRNYPLAYSMTTQDFQKQTTLRGPQEEFEHCCPLDYGEFDIPDILDTMGEWPAKRPNDIRWVYITIGGETNEAVAVIVARERKELKISEVVVGRP